MTKSAKRSKSPIRNRWLNRELVVAKHYYTLCTTFAQFERGLRRLKVPRNDWPKWGHVDAACHFLERHTGDRCVLVQCSVERVTAKKVDRIQIASLLMHEAVHIFQEECRLIGEKEPSDEFQAYGIQRIAQSLMYEWARQVNRPPKRAKVSKD